MSDLMVVGPKFGGQGTFSPFTAGISGQQRVSDAHARYMQAVLEGRVFMLDSDSATAVAAHTTKGALGTFKFLNGFYNPPGSGKNAVLWRAAQALVSGTPAGPLLYNGLYYTGKLTQAATGTVRNALLGAGAGASAMQAAVGVVLASTPADTSTAMLQLGVMGGQAAVAAGAGVNSSVDELAGCIVVPPGCAFGLAALGVGTSHVLQSTLIWEEVPLLVQS